MKGRIFIISLVCFYGLMLVVIQPVFSQDFSRNLELKSPQMNGQDVVNLQKKLFSLGFYNVGEADGYYGTLTEAVIKNIQTFLGFESNGKTDRNLWNSIFNRANESYLKNVSAVLRYNIVSMHIEAEAYWARGESYHSNIRFYEEDLKICIQEHRHGYEYRHKYYFINKNQYFVISFLTGNFFDDGVSRDITHFFDGTNLYKLENGIRLRSNDDSLFPGGIFENNEY